MATELASLVLRMSADSAQLRADIKKVQTDMGKMRKSAQSLESGFNGMSRTIKGAFAGLGVGIGISGIVRSFDALTDSLDKIGDVAEKIGVTTDQLQELRYVAGQFGSNAEELDKSLGQFVRRLGEAAQGEGELLKILDAYSISVRDASGNTRDSVDVISDLADVIQRAESDVERARIAYNAFGRAGMALVPMLRNGSSGLDDMRQRAHDLGLVIDGEAIQASSDFRDRLDELSKAFTALQADALGPLIPQITEFVVQLRDSIREGGGAKKVIDELAESFEQIAKLTGVIALAGFGLSRGGPLGAMITGGAGALAIYREEIGKWLAVPELKRLLNGEDIGAPKLLEGEDPFAQARKTLGTPGVPTVTIDTSKPKLKPLPVIRPISDDTDKEAERRVKQIQSIIASLQEEAATYGLTAEQIAVYKLEQLGASDAQLAMARALTEKIDLLTDEEEAMEASRQAAEEAAEAIHQSRLEDQKLIETLAEEIGLMQLGNRERAQEEAVRQLSAQATDEQREAVRKLAGELYDLQDAAKEAAFSIEEFAREGARDIQDALGDQLFNFMQGKFDDIAGSFKQMIDRMVADALAAKIGEALMGGFAGGGSLGGFFGSILPSIAGVFGGGGGNAAAAGAGAAGLDSLIGGFLTGGLAAGGPALPGNMYLVGEEGPELFAPGVAGRVIPNDAMPNGVTVNINVSGVRDEGHLRQSASQVAAQAAVALQRASRRNN